MTDTEFTLPQLTVKTYGAFEKMKAGFAVAGGRRPCRQWLKAAAFERSLYCADAGAVYCAECGLVPQILCGDCDSAETALYSFLKQQGTEIKQYNPLKDDTDLQLLLEEIPRQPLIVSGIWGGRFDHLYSNVFSLLAYREKYGYPVIMADEQEVMLLLKENEQAELNLADWKKVTAVSLLPLSKSCCVSLNGVYWPLNEGSINLLHPYAVSNVPLGERISCSCHKGAAGLYLCFAK